MRKRGFDKRILSTTVRSSDRLKANGIGGLSPNGFSVERFLKHCTGSTQRKSYDETAPATPPL